MGRYTSVQSYSDNNPNVAKADYKAATTEDGKTKKLKTESVGNVSGSTAGAGSGEFHSYRNARRTEMLRVEKMEKDHAVHLKAVELKDKISRSAAAVEKRTEKLRKKRQRKKQRKLDRKHYGAAPPPGVAAAAAAAAEASAPSDAAAGGGAASARAQKRRKKAGSHDAEAAAKTGGAAAEAGGAASAVDAAVATERAPNRNVFENDGSFLAQFGAVR